MLIADGDFGKIYPDNIFYRKRYNGVMRSCPVFSILLAVVVFTCCRRDSTPPDPPSAKTPSITENSPDDPVDPYTLLDRMIIAYKSAISYSDHATVQIIGKMSLPDTKPVPWKCTVAFLRPNRLRLEIYDGKLVSDGEDCYAQIRLLDDQVLHFSTPDNWTIETLFQDVYLDAAIAPGLPQSVLRFPPQLILLFADNPLNTFCPRGAKVEWIAQQQIDQVTCDVIQISHSDGNRILWISKETSALLRLDYQPVGLPVPEGFDSIEVIRIEITDARFDWNLVAETFQMIQYDDAVQVAEFRSDILELPTPEEHRRMLKLMTDSDTYRLIDQQIESAIPSEPTLSPKTAPKIFILSPVWTQPLMSVYTMTLLSDETPTLLVPYEGNLVAILDLKGKILRKEKESPKGLEDSTIRNVQSNFISEKRRIGIITFDGKFHLFDVFFKPVETIKEEVLHFRFIRHREEELLLLAVKGAVRAMDPQGTVHWEHTIEGMPNQISSAMIDDQPRIFVSCSASQDSFLILSPEGVALKPIEIPFGRHILWFQVVGTTIYSLVEYADTDDVRFVGYDMTGKSQWSRLLPTGEYEVNPVYVSNKKMWFVPTPSGEIWVFDHIGNKIDAFSLDTIPTGLLCLEINGETLLIVTDGETVSALKMTAL